MSLHIPHMNSLEPTMSPGVLYTNDNEDTNNDANNNPTATSFAVLAIGLFGKNQTKEKKNKFILKEESQ